MPNFPGGWELVLVLLVIVVVFGSKRLPDSARALGKSMRILKAETKGLRDDDDARTPTTTTVAATVVPTAVVPPAPVAPAPVPPVPAQQVAQPVQPAPVQPAPLHPAPLHPVHLAKSEPGAEHPSTQP